MRDCHISRAGRIRLAGRGGWVVFLALATLGWANQPPEIVDFRVTPIPSSGGQRVRVQCLASDAEGEALLFNWSTLEGALVGADAHASQVVWDLPAGEGNRMVSVEVRDSNGGSTRGERLVPIGPVYPYRQLTGGLRQPARVATDSQGNLWMTDTARNKAVHMTPTGQVLGEFATGPRPLGIAVALDGTVLVGESGRHRVVRYDTSGTTLGVLGGGQPSLLLPNAIAVEPGSGRIHVVDSKSAAIRVFSAQGVLLSSYGGIGVLEYPVAIAINGALGEIYIGDQSSATVVVFNTSGTKLRGFGSQGSMPGQFGRIQGLALDSDGLLLVLDSFQNNIQLMSPTGSSLAIFGQLGNGTGAMRTPLGIACVPGERIFATSSGTGDIDVFGHWSWLDPNEPSTGTGVVFH